TGSPENGLVMADDRISRVLLTWQVNRSEIEQVKSSTDSIIQGLGKIGDNAASSTETVKKLTEASKGLDRAIAFDKVVKGFGDLAKSTGKWDDALIEVRKSLREAGASADEISGATQAFKELETAANSAAVAEAKTSGGGGLGAEGLRRTGGALSQLG